jgi:hypothetical protein
MFVRAERGRTECRVNCITARAPDRRTVEKQQDVLRLTSEFQRASESGADNADCVGAEAQPEFTESQA